MSSTWRGVVKPEFSISLPKAAAMPTISPSITEIAITLGLFG